MTDSPLQLILRTFVRAFWLGIIVMVICALNGCAAGYFSDGTHRVAYARLGDRTSLEAFEMQAGDNTLSVGKLDSERMTAAEAAMTLLRVLF